MVIYVNPSNPRNLPHRLYLTPLLKALPFIIMQDNALDHAADQSATTGLIRAATALERGKERQNLAHGHGQDGQPSVRPPGAAVKETDDLAAMCSRRRSKGFDDQ